MQKCIATHAQSDCPAFSDVKMIQEREGIQGTLAVCNGFLRVGRVSMTASVGHYQHVFAHEVVTPRVGPILMATCTSME